MEGKINAIVGGPNCRTRSLLRHIPIPGQPSAPRPIRRWGGEEFGIHDATEDEKQKLHEDDILMWRFWFLYMVAVYMRRARKVEAEVTVSLEQPATLKEFMPEVVSWWDTKEWAELAREFSFEESTFKQGDLGGLTPKPTMFGGNLELYVAGHQRRCRAGERVSYSSQLSRWAPGLMSMVASALIGQVEGATFKGKAMSWSEHMFHTGEIAEYARRAHNNVHPIDWSRTQLQGCFQSTPLVHSSLLMIWEGTWQGIF